MQKNRHKKTTAQAYKDVILLKRKFYVITLLLIPIGYMLYLGLIALNCKVALAQCLTWIFILLGNLINSIYLMAYSHCPWCKQNFYFAGGGSQARVQTFFAKQCKHCGMPDKKLDDL